MSYRLDPRMEGDGFYMDRMVAAENLGARKLVYLNADTEWALADANVAARMPTMGITQHAITAGQKGTILTYGLIGDSSWTWTVGGSIYASTTAGELTQTPPTAIGNIVQRIAIAFNATMAFFHPQLDTTEAAMVVEKEQFFVASDDDNMTNVPGKSITNGQTAYIGVHFPEGFDALVGFNIYVIPNATQAAANWDVATTYGGAGEAYNIHGESDAAATYNVTDNQWFEIDAEALGMFASAEEEDTGGISVTVGTAGHNVTVVMAEMYYTC